MCKHTYSYPYTQPVHSLLINAFIYSFCEVQILNHFFPAVLLCFPVYDNHSSDLIATDLVKELSQKRKHLAPLCWTHNSWASERATNHLLTQPPVYLPNDWARPFTEIMRWKELSSTLFLTHILTSVDRTRGCGFPSHPFINLPYC